MFLIFQWCVRYQSNEHHARTECSGNNDRVFAIFPDPCPDSSHFIRDPVILIEYSLITNPFQKIFDYFNVMPGHGQYFNCRFKEKGKTWRDGVSGGIVTKGYLTDVITDFSINWLENRNSNKPFFLMVHHKAPHAPHDPDEKHVKMFDSEDIPEPPTLYDDWETRPAAANATGDSKIANCSYPEYGEHVN